MTKQTFLISDEEELARAINMVQNSGYYVSKCLPIHTDSIKTSTDLVGFFYSTLQFFHPDRILHYSPNSTLDRRMASYMVKNRMSTGCNKSRALQECALIIKTIIEHEEDLNLNFKITSMAVLGQDGLKWVTDRAITILNGENEEVENTEYKVFYDALCSQQEKETLLLLDGNIKHLQKVLGDL